MKFLKTAVVYAKTMPKAVWVAAVILPGGLVAVGAYLAVKSVSRIIRKKKRNDQG